MNSKLAVETWRYFLALALIIGVVALGLLFAGVLFSVLYLLRG